MGGKLAHWCIDHRRWVFAAMLLLVVALGALIPRIQIDTDPENMLPDDQPARVLHNNIEQQFSLHDRIVVGQVNTAHPQGVFNPGSLADHYRLTRAIEDIEGVIESDLHRRGHPRAAGEQGRQPPRGQRDPRCGRAHRRRG